MRERDLRQEAYKECKKNRRMETILFFTILAIAVVIITGALIPVSFYWGIGADIILIMTACFFYSITRKKLQTDLRTIRQGILTEAEVVEIIIEENSDGNKVEMAVYEITLPGGRKHHVKEPTSTSDAGVLGVIRTGVKLPVFVDQNNPDNFYAVKSHLMRQPIQDINSPILDKYLQKPREIWDMPPDRNLVRRGKLSLWIFYILMGIILTALFGVIVSSVYDNWRNNTCHDDIELPSGTYVSLINTTKVYQYFPETNEWSYHLSEFGVTRTKNWRFDSKCREPLEISYTSLKYQDASDWPVLLIPESYRDRLDEFIKDEEDTGTTPL